MLTLNTILDKNIHSIRIKVTNRQVDRQMERHTTDKILQDSCTLHMFKKCKHLIKAVSLTINKMYGTHCISKIACDVNQGVTYSLIILQ